MCTFWSFLVCQCAFLFIGSFFSFFFCFYFVLEPFFLLFCLIYFLPFSFSVVLFYFRFFKFSFVLILFFLGFFFWPLIATIHALFVLLCLFNPISTLVFWHRICSWGMGREGGGVKLLPSSPSSFLMPNTWNLTQITQIPFYSWCKMRQATSRTNNK